MIRIPIWIIWATILWILAMNYVSQIDTPYTAKTSRAYIHSCPSKIPKYLGKSRTSEDGREGMVCLMEYHLIPRRTGCPLWLLLVIVCGLMDKRQ
jgi:hypothetical protein